MPGFGPQGPQKFNPVSCGFLLQAIWGSPPRTSVDVTWYPFLDRDRAQCSQSRAG